MSEFRITVTASYLLVQTFVDGQAVGEYFASGWYPVLCGVDALNGTPTVVRIRAF